MERKTQLYFRDDNKFEFRKLPLQYSCFLEKSGDKITKAWPHSYNGQYYFPGYKNIGSDTVTLGFARDIFLDPHGKIPDNDEASGKPKKGKIAEWIAKIATNQRHIYQSKRSGSTMADYINWCLIGAIFIIVIAWAIPFAQRGGG